MCLAAIRAVAGCALALHAAWNHRWMSTAKTALRSLIVRIQEMLGGRVMRREMQWVEMPALWPSPKRFHASAQTIVQRSNDA